MATGLEPAGMPDYTPNVQTTLFTRWRASFLAGLAVILPAFATIAIVLWLFGSVSNITDKLLFFMPRGITHTQDGNGPVYWYWSIAALALAVLLITLIGLMARYYFAKRVLQWMDVGMLRVPMVNKIYGAIKQVNEAFTSNKKSAFKTVVLVEFPRAGSYSVGFLTSEGHQDVQARKDESLVCVFVPTTPNPTSGFLLLVPEKSVVKLQMSVADGIKFVISLGAVAPPWSAQSKVPSAPAETERSVVAFD